MLASNFIANWPHRHAGEGSFLHLFIYLLIQLSFNAPDDTQSLIYPSRSKGVCQKLLTTVFFLQCEDQKTTR